MKSRIDAINFLVKKYNFTKYLEIGVRNPALCFDRIECVNKIGVDPGYEDPSYEADYKYTSDDFFCRLENNLLDLSRDYKWDLIFIDGLHLSFQVEKDIFNSLNHLNENGIIVLHDCDPFLYEEKYTRLIEDYWGQNWNGTVWKTIYKLKATRSDLKICTLAIDEGLGIIKKGKQDLILFDNPYFEYKIFQKNRKKYLNLIGQSEFLNWLSDD